MTTLRQGDRSPAVRELQLLLMMTGYDTGPIDGIFGPRTQLALRHHFADTMLECPMPVDDVDERAEADLGSLTFLRALPRRAVEVPRVLTPASAIDVRIALVAGYAAAFGDVAESLTSAALAVRVALAQLCVEHGCRRWSMTLIDELAAKGLTVPAHLRPPHGAEAFVYLWTNNIGNRQVTREDMARNIRPDSPAVPHFLLAANEGEGAAVRKLTSACYAYPNLAEGAAGYWRFLRDHCGPALAAFERGDPAAAAHELKVGRWHYSGSEAEYARAMVDRFRAIP